MCLNKVLIDWLIDWLIGWLIDRLIRVFVSHGSNLYVGHSLPQNHDPSDLRQGSRALALSNTRSPRFTDFPSNLANLIGWECETNTLHMLRKSGPELVIPTSGQKDRGSGNENVRYVHVIKWPWIYFVRVSGMFLTRSPILFLHLIAAGLVSFMIFYSILPSYIANYLIGPMHLFTIVTVHFSPCR